MGAQWKAKHKEVAANAKGKIFGKLSKEIMVAARNGADPAMNPRLRLAVEQAKKASMPRDTLERAIKKGAGLLDGGVNFEKVTYEGFAPHRVPIIVECLTDNVNRTISSMRVLFRKGQLGASGSVAWDFDHLGMIEASPAKADADAEYTKVYEIDLSEIKEPILCCPNDPDDAKLLSTVAGDKIDEVFIGSCMTNIGHFRAAGKLLEKVEGGSLSTRLWLAPPTKMDQHQLMEEGYYNIYGRAGARTEMPGCSLCMGNQARVAPNTTCVSTSTRNFPNRLGQGSNVYLASAELASVAAVMGKLPTVAEYMEYANKIDSMAGDIYRYLNFDRMAEYTDKANKIDVAQLT